MMATTALEAVVQATVNPVTRTSTTTVATQPERDENVARYEILVLATIFAMIVFGNVSVLVALIGGRLKMRRMYYFLLHLSIADLITGFFTVLPQLGWEITHRFKFGGYWGCKAVKYLQLLGPYLSSYVLVVTAIDRYQAICFPLGNCTWTAKRSKLMITLAWLVSCLCCCPQLLIFTYQPIDPEGTVWECWGTFPDPPWGERAYVTWYAISVFFIPLVILTFTYVCICREIWLNAKRSSKLNKAQNQNLASNYNAAGSGRESIPNDSEMSSHHALPDSGGTSMTGMSSSSGTLRTSRGRNNQNRLIVEVGTNFRFRPQSAAGGQRAPQQVRCFVEPEMSGSSASEDAQSRHSVSSRYAVNMIVPRSTQQPGRLSRAKIKTIKITIVVICCYVFCSMPFICVQLWAYWWPNAQESDLWKGPLVAIAMLLSSLNSCVNPWIYLFFNRNLFHTLRKICCHPFNRLRGRRPPSNGVNGPGRGHTAANSSMHSEAYPSICHLVANGPTRKNSATPEMAQSSFLSPTPQGPPRRKSSFDFDYPVGPVSHEASIRSRSNSNRDLPRKCQSLDSADRIVVLESSA